MLEEPDFVPNELDEEKSKQDEFIQDVMGNEPRFVVGVDHPLSIMKREDSKTSVLVYYGNLTRKEYNLIGVADIFNSSESKYVFGDDAPLYQPKGENQVYLFELKDQSK